MPYLVAEMASDNARLLSYFLDKISFGGQDPKVIMINFIYHSHKICALYFFDTTCFILGNVFLNMNIISLYVALLSTIFMEKHKIFIKHML